MPRYSRSRSWCEDVIASPSSWSKGAANRQVEDEEQSCSLHTLNECNKPQLSEMPSERRRRTDETSTWNFSNKLGWKRQLSHAIGRHLLALSPLHDEEVAHCLVLYGWGVDKMYPALRCQRPPGFLREGTRAVLVLDGSSRLLSFVPVFWSSVIWTRHLVLPSRLVLSLFVVWSYHLILWPSGHSAVWTLHSLLCESSGLSIVRSSPLQVARPSGLLVT